MLQIAAFLITAASLTIVQARALSGLLARIDLGGGGLSARQIPDVPAQCASVCEPVNVVLSGGGCPPAQCCTASFDNSYFNCYECVAQSISLTDYSRAQQIIDALYNQCAMRGVALPKLTFPGQDPSRALTSVVGTSSGASTPSSSVATSTSPASHTVVTAPTIIPASTTSLIQSVVTSLPTTSSSPSPTASASSGRQAMGEVSLVPLSVVMIVGAWVMTVGCF